MYHAWQGRSLNHRHLQQFPLGLVLQSLASREDTGKLRHGGRFSMSSVATQLEACMVCGYPGVAVIGLTLATPLSRLTGAPRNITSEENHASAVHGQVVFRPSGLTIRVQLMATMGSLSPTPCPFCATDVRLRGSRGFDAHRIRPASPVPALPQQHGISALDATGASVLVLRSLGLRHSTSIA